MTMLDTDKKRPLPRARWLAGLAVGALTLSSAAHAETLQEALAKAYENNPTLTAARAGQRANDENVPIQKSSGLPNVGVGVDYQENLVLPGQQLFLAQALRQRRRPGVGADLSGRRGAQRGEGRQISRRGGSGRPARDRGEHFCADRRRLYGRHPRSGDRPAEPEECRGAAHQFAGDERPVRDRRPDAHRRCAIGSAARAGRGRSAHRRSEPDRQPRILCPAGRRSAGRSGTAAAAAEPARLARRSRRDRADQQPRHRSGESGGQCQPRRHRRRAREPAAQVVGDDERRV